MVVSAPTSVDESTIAPLATSEYVIVSTTGEIVARGVVDGMQLGNLQALLPTWLPQGAYFISAWDTKSVVNSQILFLR